MIRVVMNTAPEAQRERIVREVAALLEVYPEEELLLVSIRGLEAHLGFIVSVETARRPLGAWAFNEPGEIRPRLLGSVALA